MGVLDNFAFPLPVDELERASWLLDNEKGNAVSQTSEGGHVEYPIPHEALDSDIANSGLYIKPQS